MTVCNPAVRVWFALVVATVTVTRCPRTTGEMTVVMVPPTKVLVPVLFKARMTLTFEVVLRAVKGDAGAL